GPPGRHPGLAATLAPSPPPEPRRAGRSAPAGNRADPAGFLRGAFGQVGVTRRAHHFRNVERAQREERNDPADVAQSLEHVDRLLFYPRVNSRRREGTMGRVEDKVAIVTGAGSGIGRAGAVALAREGARVVATDLSQSSAEETAAAIQRSGGEAIALAHDVGEEPQWADVIDATRKAFGQLDVLVNNAGISGKGSLADTAPEDWRALMRVNLDGVYFGTRAAIAAMQPEGKTRDQFGSIIMISSILG